MLVSLTRLRVRSLLNMPAFLWMTTLAQRQTTRAPGFMGGRLLVDRRNTYWTLTLWGSEKAMRAFRGTGAHARVMPRLAKWCDEAAYTHWMIAGDSMPQWPEAYEHLVSDGKLSHVEQPSQDHSARKFPEPRLQPLIGQNLSPKASADKRV